MMKQFTLDYEIIALLEKEENMSGLVNDLLYNHFYETPNFKRLRIINRLKLLKAQKLALENEEKKLSLEVEKITKKEVVFKK